MAIPWPEHGSAYRGPHVQLDNAHGGELITTVVRPDTVRSSDRFYHIIRCAPCTVIHAWPLPDETALATYYAEQFFNTAHPDYLARYERDREWWIATHHGILSQAQRALAERELLFPWRVLDIGTGPGIALDVAKSLGFNTYGIELDATMAAHVSQRGHQVWTFSLADLHAQRAENAHPLFECLYAYEVLEHQACADDFLLQCWDLLAPEGILVVEVPNEWNALQLEACKRFGLQPWWVQPPEHLTMFSPKTLQLLLRRCGFDVLDIRGTYPLEQFMLDTGEVYVGNDRLGRKFHTERMQYELGMWRAGRWQEVEALYRKNLQEANIGREIVAISRKRE